MLQRVPIIERCDDTWDSTRSPESPVLSVSQFLVSAYDSYWLETKNDINRKLQVLVRIYTNLLDFYFEAMDVLKGKSFFISLQKSRFEQRLPEIVSSFTENADQLDKHLNVEALALIQKIDDDQSSIKRKYLIQTQTQKLT